MSDRPDPTPALSETFSAPPADEDRLRERLQQITPLTAENADDLIRAGITLPPEPEPQERYYVDKVGQSYWVLTGDRVKEKMLAQCPESADAERIACLLNADERHRDELGERGIVAAWADAIDSGALLAARVKELEGAERVGRSHIAHLDARVKELEGELAEANIAINGGCSCPAPYVDCPHDEPLLPALNDARAKLAEWAAKQAESQAAISSLRSRAEEAEARVRLLEGEAADRVEPLFTSVVAHEVESGRWLKVRIPADDHDKVSVHDKVDVYVHGARPAPRAITAEDVKDAIAVTHGSWYIPSGGFGELADALNARPAGDKPQAAEGHAVMNGFTITDAETGEHLAGPEGA